MVTMRVSDLSPGMCLAGDVRDISGRLLLAEGKEITTKNLKTFKAWGITEINVQELPQVQQPGEEGGASAQEASDPTAQLSEKTKDYFCQTDLKHPLIQELLQYHTDPPEPESSQTEKGASSS